MTRRTVFFFYGCSIDGNQRLHAVGAGLSAGSVQIPDNFQHAPEAALELTYPEDRWWQVFGDEEIDLFVNEVLKNN